ncbi:MAG: ATP-binding protein [Chitinophagales bacterium]
MNSGLQQLRVFVVDDDDDDLLLITEYLQTMENYRAEITTERNSEKALIQILNNEHDVYIVDYRLGARTGVELIKVAAQAGITKPFILLTGAGDKYVDLEAANAGAYDYLVKSEINAVLLERCLRYCMEYYNTHQELRESESRYRDIFTKTNEIIFVADQHFRIVNFNPVFTATLGYEAHDLQNKNLKDLFLRDELAAAFISSLAESGSISDIEVELIGKGGIPKSFLASCLKIELSGEGAEYLGIFHDYSVIKKASAERLLREKTAATAKLVARLADEIHRPLTEIENSVEELQPLVDEDQEFYLNIIKSNSKRIEGLVSELMKISNPSENKLEAIDAKELCLEALQQAKDRIELNHIKLHSYFPEENILLKVDREKLRIALLNIIINAIEAMEAGKGELHLSLQFTGSTVKIKIADNGGGIPDDVLPRLFQPYFTGKKNGMGLGLANTHSIIQSHGGEIGVESQLGKGTVFSLTLPLVSS